jgi:F0F1-type ATP synthase membrane subunit b/b'
MNYYKLAFEEKQNEVYKKEEIIDALRKELETLKNKLSEERENYQREGDKLRNQM